MSRYLAFIALILVAFGIVFLAPGIVNASPNLEPTSPSIPGFTPTPNMIRSDPPPTVYPPIQADNGAQAYWGMCIDCHGDSGQGLTEEWIGYFTLEYRDCWQSGCHGHDDLDNSFEIPQTGAPALSGSGSLDRFSNIYQLQSYVMEKMPLSPTGSLTKEQSFSLVAYILQLRGQRIPGFTLNDTNSSAIPLHDEIEIPDNNFRLALILSGIFFLTFMGIILRVKGFKLTSKRSLAKPSFFHHLHPPRIPAEQSRFRYTLGSGGLAMFLSLMLLLTGLVEMYYYVPSPDQAALSIQTITTLVPLGSLIRNLHYWSAQFLVIVMTIHLMRVVLTGAYAPPRQFNYLLGLGLLVMILLLDFTGYVLRWDEGIRWALVVGTNLLKTIPWIGDSLYHFVVGGSELVALTVTRFYGWHVFGLTFLGGILIVWHAFRVRRDGGIAVPAMDQEHKKETITRFELVHREVQTMIFAGIVLLLISILIPAPIDQPLSDAGTLTSNSGAPWFFLWIQQLLKQGNPLTWGVLLPIFVVVVLGSLPYLLPNAKEEELGRWLPVGNRIAQMLTAVIIFVILLMTVWGALTH